MVCIALHKLFISENDPSQPRWQLEVNELDLIREFSFVRRLRTTSIRWFWEATHCFVLMG